jgi:DNA end-binding protein Ku
MPVKSTGTATISFGLVSVPVHIYSSAESRSSVSFNMLHKKCGTRVKQQYVCPKDNNEVVPRDEMVKGYEFAKDQYVIFTPEELKALDEKATGTIDINEFVPLAEVDREYLEKVYYLGPDKGGDRAYRLLAKALNETGRAALGQYASRGQQYLVLLRPKGNVLVMEQLHYADEMKSATEVPIPDGDVKDSELKLAKQLIDQGTSETFEPAKYKDTVRERVMEAIQGKVEGHEITTEPAQDGGGKIIDLMEALKASLASGGDGEDEEEEEAAPKKKAKKKAS